MKRSEEYRAIESRRPGWHIYESDAAHPWAVKVHPADYSGCGVTLEGHSVQRVEQIICEWEHAHACEGHVDLVAPMGFVRAVA